MKNNASNENIENALYVFLLVALSGLAASTKPNPVGNGGFPQLREAVSKSGHMYRMALLSQKN